MNYDQDHHPKCPKCPESEGRNRKLEKTLDTSSKKFRYIYVCPICGSEFNVWHKDVYRVEEVSGGE